MTATKKDRVRHAVRSRRILVSVGPASRSDVNRIHIGFALRGFYGALEHVADCRLVVRYGSIAYCLVGARLAGARLGGAKLSGADLTAATYSRKTRWPKGYDPKDKGPILEE